MKNKIIAIQLTFIAALILSIFLNLLAPLIFFYLMGCNLCLAQTDTIKIDEVEISSYRVPTLYSETSRVVTIITKEEIEDTPVQSLQDLLEYAMNVDVRQRGNHGVQADISIRGGSFEQTLILLNGVKLNDPQTGHHNLNLPIEIEDIERIEILHGPGSRVFGPNAFSGAINIITKSEEHKNIKLSLMGGEYSFYSTSLSGSLPISIGNSKMKNYISLTNKISDEYFAPADSVSVKNTDFNIFNIFYQTSINTNAFALDVQAGYCDKAFGANSFYSAKYPFQFEQIKTTFINLKMNTGEKVRFTPGIYWRRHKDRFELFREGSNWYTKGDSSWFSADDTVTWYNGHNYHLTDVYGADLNVSFKSKFGRTAFGSEYRSENILSNKLGVPMNDTINVPGEPDGKYTHSASRENISFFVEHSVFLKKFAFSTGLLANWNSDFYWKIYPGIDMSYKLSDNIKLFGSVNQSLRVPTYTDLYYVGPDNIGNSNLKPEEALTYEIGAKYSKSFLTGHISIFRREGKNIIDWVKLVDTLKWESKNITELITNGFEFSGNILTKKLFGDKFPFKYFNVSYTYLDLEKQSGDYISKYVLDYLKHKLTISTQHKIYKDFGASWRFSFQDRAGTYTDFESGKEVEYEPFSMVDARIFWKRKLLTVYAEVTNLLNERYYDIGNIVMPGRWIRGGIIISPFIK